MKTWQDNFEQGLDAYNEIEQCWDEIEKRSFTARYHGKTYDGSKIVPGDTISRLTSGGYVKIN